MKRPIATPCTGRRYSSPRLVFTPFDTNGMNTLSKTMGGCCAFNAGKVFIVATFDEKKNQTSVGCSTVVSDLAKYLKEALK